MHVLYLDKAGQRRYSKELGENLTALMPMG